MKGIKIGLFGLALMMFALIAILRSAAAWNVISLIVAIAGILVMIWGVAAKDEQPHNEGHTEIHSDRTDNENKNNMQ